MLGRVGILPARKDHVVVQSSQTNHPDPSALFTVAAPSVKPVNNPNLNAVGWGLVDNQLP